MTVWYFLVLLNGAIWSFGPHGKDQCAVLAALHNQDKKRPEAYCISRRILRDFQQSESEGDVEFQPTWNPKVNV